MSTRQPADVWTLDMVDSSRNKDWVQSWDKLAIFLINYRQDAAKRQTAGIVFTHRPKIGFFAPQGRLVAPIRVKLCRTDGHLGPLGCAKFHV